MVYRKFKDLSLSALGLGCMRLPRCEETGEIDMEATRRMVAMAIENGVNYFDTAWFYHGGKSETVIGEILGAYPRESFYLATKFPGIDVSNIPKGKEIFEKQLEKCGVDYFDFYLFHNVCEENVDAYLDPKYGLLPYLLEQKRLGHIRHLGFSAHGDLPVIERFLKACGGEMEFCQLQINYIDWTLQSAREKVELCRRYGVPVWVMEPLRGGKLCHLPDAAKNELSAVSPDRSMPSWAFGFLRSVPEVTMILSGMSSEEQMRDNLALFAEEDKLTEKENHALLEVAARLINADTVYCTACRYCTDHCPQSLPIPTLLSLYNELRFREDKDAVKAELAAIGADRAPQNCLGCRSCEEFCPQHIKISERLADFSSLL